MAAEEPVFELEEVKRHSKEEDCWLVIDGHVYDVTKFLDEHPGGFDIILQNTGKDATEEYEEIGHSKAAHELLQQHKIGKFKGGKPAAAKAKKGSAVTVSSTESSTIITILKVLLPVVVLAAIFLPKLLKQE